MPSAPASYCLSRLGSEHSRPKKTSKAASVNDHQRSDSDHHLQPARKDSHTAPVPTATVIRPVPKLAPAENRSALSPDLADDVRPTQQQRRISPVTTSTATTDDDKFEPTYADLAVRRDEEGKPCKPHIKYSFQK